MSPNDELLRIRGSARRRCRRRADQCCDAGDAADDEGEDLLEAVADSERVEHADRGEQSDEMAHEKHDHAEMEEIRPDHHLPTPEKLAGLRAPGILIGVETQDTAKDQYGDRDVGKPAEGKLIDEVFHDGLLSSWSRRPLPGPPP